MTKRGLRLAGVVFALVLALTSCVSPEELRREDEATCAGYALAIGHSGPICASRLICKSASIPINETSELDTLGASRSRL